MRTEAGGPSRLACDCGLRSRQLQLLAHDGDGLALECRTAVAASSGRFVKLRQASSSFVKRGAVTLGAALAAGGRSLSSGGGAVVSVFMRGGRTLSSGAVVSVCMRGGRSLSSGGSGGFGEESSSGEASSESNMLGSTSGAASGALAAPSIQLQGDCP